MIVQRWSTLEAALADWELDAIIGKGHRQAIVSLTERKSRYTFIRKVKRKTARYVSHVIISLLTPFSEQGTHTDIGSRQRVRAPLRLMATGAQREYQRPSK